MSYVIDKLDKELMLIRNELTDLLINREGLKTQIFELSLHENELKIKISDLENAIKVLKNASP